jgi:hypothetical protein
VRTTDVRGVRGQGSARVMAAVLALLTALVGEARQGGTGIPDLSDGWVRIDTEGSGSFQGLTEKFAPAVLTPEAAAQMKTAPPPPPRFDFARDPSAGPKKEGEAYVVTEGRCFGMGIPLEPNSAAFFITQTKDKVLITREGAGARHLYLDGRAHPDLTVWTPTALGHSVARYEGGDLLVETVGLTPGNVTAGGRRSPETRFAERYHLSPDGKRLTITYTWTDPKIYQRPHSYSLTFERFPADGYAIEDWCDSSDPRTSQSIVPPKQIP